MKTDMMPAAAGTQNGNTKSISILNGIKQMCVVECL